MRVRYAGPGEGTTGAPESSLTDGAPAYAIAPSLPGLRAGLRPSCTLHRSRALSACSAQHKGLRRGRAVSRTLRRTASRLCSMGAARENRAELPASRFFSKKARLRKTEGNRQAPPPISPKRPALQKKCASGMPDLGKGRRAPLSLPCLPEPRHTLSHPLCRGLGQASAPPALCTAP